MIKKTSRRIKAMHGEIKKKIEEKSKKSEVLYKRAEIINNDQYDERFYRARLRFIKEMAKAKKYIETANIMFVVLRKDGNIKFVNSKTCKILGYTKEELINKNWFEDIIAPLSRKDVFKTYKKIIDGNEREDNYFENYAVRSDALHRIIGWNVTIFRNLKNEIEEILISGQDITERKRIEEELKIYATMDVMTGVFNRRTGISLLEKQISMTKRKKAKLTVCYIDINNLKYVNDIYGHAEGDELIICISKLLKEGIRESDTVCRMGGDEFLIIFPECSVNDAEKIIQRICNEIENLNRYKMKNYKISMSHGCEEYSFVNQYSIEEIIGMADQKMYNAKKMYKELNML